MLSLMRITAQGEEWKQRKEQKTRHQNHNFQRNRIEEQQNVAHVIKVRGLKNVTLRLETRILAMLFALQNSQECELQSVTQNTYLSHSYDVPKPRKSIHKSFAKLCHYLHCTGYISTMDKS